MSGHRHRFAESLAEWADLHGETLPQPTWPLTEHCPVHGVYTPEPTGDCGRCLDDHDVRERTRRQTAWATEDGADRADAHHDAHQQ